MPERVRTASAEPDLGTTLMLAAIFGVTGVGVLLWAGGALASLLTGRGVPHAAAISGLRTLAHAGDPARGWQTAMPGPIAYWTTCAVVLLVATVIVAFGVRWWRRDEQKRRADIRTTDGLATRQQVRSTASAKALTRRAAVLRPSLAHARP